MLTYTYSLVTLQIEQKKARRVLTTIRGQFQNCICDRTCSASQCFATALDRLIEFDESHHRRNIELYVIPAVREATHDADGLLAELDALSEMSGRTLERVCEYIRHLPRNDDAVVQELCGAMECYCENLLERLDREERELFPIAQRTISHDGWFQLASQFISHSEEIQRINHTRAVQHAAA